MRFGLLDLVAAVLTTVFVVATLLALRGTPVRWAVLAGGAVGFGIGWRLALRRSWEYKFLLMPGVTCLGMAAGAGLWAVYG